MRAHTPHYCAIKRTLEVKMATWHQLQRPVQLYHETKWTVVIDPPNDSAALMCFSTRDLAEVYMRGLKDNNPGAARYAYILPPCPKAWVREWAARGKSEKRLARAFAAACVPFRNVPRG
jgi:hypothetical protein